MIGTTNCKKSSKFHIGFFKIKDEDKFSIKIPLNHYPDNIVMYDVNSNNLKANEDTSSSTHLVASYIVHTKQGDNYCEGAFGFEKRYSKSSYSFTEAGYCIRSKLRVNYLEDEKKLSIELCSDITNIDIHFNKNATYFFIYWDGEFCLDNYLINK